jgi:hypothetical protein
MTSVEETTTLQGQLLRLAAHKVGNRHHEDPLILSEALINLDGLSQTEDLAFHLLGGFESDIFYRFTFEEAQPEQNPVLTSVSKIFNNPDQMHEESRHLATHLYYLLAHPKIKSGDFYMAYFSNILFEDELVNAIGLFKMESKQDFINLTITGTDSFLEIRDGYPLHQVDKGCLIYETHPDEGYRVQILDRSNKTEANYWKHTFLLLEVIPGAFHQTQNLLNLTHAYVSQQLPVEFDIEKVDQGDILKRSIDYFKHHDEFNEENFADEIFKELDLTDSFRRYKQDYQEAIEQPPDPTFPIHPDAVKQQSRHFKSVLKLDKNFHIYIHGDRNLIEKGTEADGRKFYKVYFSEER